MLENTNEIEKNLNKLTDIRSVRPQPCSMKRICEPYPIILIKEVAINFILNTCLELRSIFHHQVTAMADTRLRGFSPRLVVSAEGNPALAGISRDEVLTLRRTV